MADDDAMMRSPDRDAMNDQLRGIEWLSFRVMYLAAGIVALYATTVHIAVGENKPSVLYVLSLLVGVLLAGTLSGGLLGFIFGIPRFLRQGDAVPKASSESVAQAQTRSDRAYRSFAGNTNLEEISDWLTKIIVGIGLVQANKLIETGQALTRSFVAAASNAPGSGAIFVAVSITGLVGGFLFFYIQTRTRITLLLTDADVAAGGGRSIAKVDTAASISAPVRSAASRELLFSDASATSIPSTADEKILAVRFDQLKTADEFGAWGAAQARAGNMQVAVKSLQEAISRSPNDSRYLAMIASVRLMQDDAAAAIKALKEARTKPLSNQSELLRQELLTSLYLDPPKGFLNALDAGSSLLAQSPDATRDAMVQLWMAAACGQQYDWLKRNAGSNTEMADVRASALAYVKKVVELEPNPDAAVRKLLLSIFAATQDDESLDNDLAVFQNDDEFLEALKISRPKAEVETAHSSDAPMVGRLVEDPD